MSLVVIKAGVADSLQDTGRYGFQHQGINPSGVMDDASAQVANALVKNKLTEAVVELHFPASTFLCKQKITAAIVGANFDARVNDTPVEQNSNFELHEQDTLHFARPLYGARCYLAVHGGFRVEEWLHSKSTNTLAIMGGMHGRFLQKGDELKFAKTNEQQEPIKKMNWTKRPAYFDDDVVYVTEGREYKFLTSNAQKNFLENEFTITPQSNRMGYRMLGNALEIQAPPILSSAVTKGTIQLLPSGQLIVLMADHAATGGYPRVAHVASNCLSMMAQKSSHQKIRWKIISVEEAEKLYLHQQQQIHRLQAEINV